MTRQLKAPMETVDFSHFASRTGELLLDVGCGEGRHAIAAATLTPGLRAIALDFSHNDALTTAGRWRDLRAADRSDNEGATVLACQGDALRLPLPDNSCHQVICSEVLEHLHDYPQALREIHRILTPKGLLCVSVPRTWPEWLCWQLSEGYRNTPGGHVRIFSARVLRREIEALGFRCYHRHWAHALHSPYWWLQCLFWSRRKRSTIVACYRRCLEWDVLNRPFITRFIERILNPLCGKSVVLYFRRS